eukprot:scaffold32546_cov35-Cyclotella_meneghiniana.AAC.1
MKCTAHHICQGQLAFSILGMNANSGGHSGSALRFRRRTLTDTDFLLASRQEKAVPGNCSFLAIPQMGDTMSRCREDKARDTRLAVRTLEIGNDEGDR